jgi:hypothetical protein
MRKCKINLTYNLAVKTSLRQYVYTVNIESDIGLSLCTNTNQQKMLKHLAREF